MVRGKVLIINMYNEGSWQQGLKQAITAMRQGIYRAMMPHTQGTQFG